MSDQECVAFLQWALPRLHLKWTGYRKVRRQVCKRVKRRCRQLGLDSLGDYRAYLLAHDHEWPSLDRWCFISISRFYRDKAVFQCLQQEVLPFLARRAMAGGRHELRLWSIGCGGGEEPYTIALMWRLALEPHFPGLHLHILATDSEPRQLARARRACYSPASLRDLPPAWRAAAFDETTSDCCLMQSFREAVTFRHEDIREAFGERKFDLVLCRNQAFTYFDDTLQRDTLERIHRSLSADGILVLGAHERLPSGQKEFTPAFHGAGIYRRQIHMMREQKPSLKINEEVAVLLRKIADLLNQQEADRYRVNAYRHAAETVEQLDMGVERIVEAHGIDGLIDLPGIGTGIARSIYEYVATGRMSRLQGLEGGADPVSLFKTIPGVGDRLAERFHHELGVDTLEALELAAHNGRLRELPGLGQRRADAITASLTALLGRRKRYTPSRTGAQPEVALLLEIDKIYRSKAGRNELPKIAPKRFNPEGKAWLSVLHTTRQGWHFSALFSNTARAHELHKTGDWVVLYFYDEHHQEGQNTVVSETRGPLQGKRVVRGRERECRQYYDERLASA